MSTDKIFRTIIMNTESAAIYSEFIVAVLTNYCGIFRLFLLYDVGSSLKRFKSRKSTFGHNCIKT